MATTITTILNQAPKPVATIGISQIALNVSSGTFGVGRGKSSYEIAKEQGFEGTELEYLQGLIGLSAYQIALDEGFVGTRAEWLDSIKGDSAYAVALSTGFVGTEEEWINSLKSPDAAINPTLEDAGKFLTNDGESILWQDINKETLGLSNVDNTSDLDKPISLLVQSELNKKLNISDLESELNTQSILLDQGEI
jgi:hypothetical protein